MNKKVIGFGGKLYTGWYIEEYEKSYMYFGIMKTEKYEKCIYVCNLSKDLEEAKRKWETDNIDKTLHGHTTIIREHKSTHNAESTVKPKLEPEQIPFGKYKYERISETKAPNDYLYWLFNNLSEEYEIIKKQIIDRLTKSDYTYINNELYKNDDPSLQYTIKKIKFRKALENKETLSIPIFSNPQADGTFEYNNMILRFPEVVKRFYNGFTYYLPAKNGKGKLIKNKTLIVTKYDVNKNEIEILDFDIIK